MDFIYASIFLLLIAMSSCQKKEEGKTDWNGIVQNVEEEPASEWRSPIESELLSGNLSVEEAGQADPLNDDLFR
jgi:hypothetical protein